MYCINWRKYVYFQRKSINSLKDQKDKYDGITVKTDYLEALKSDLEEVFQ